MYPAIELTTDTNSVWATFIRSGCWDIEWSATTHTIVFDVPEYTDHRPMLKEALAAMEITEAVIWRDYPKVKFRNHEDALLFYLKYRV